MADEKGGTKPGKAETTRSAASSRRPKDPVTIDLKARPIEKPSGSVMKPAEATSAPRTEPPKTASPAPGAEVRKEPPAEPKAAPTPPADTPPPRPTSPPITSRAPEPNWVGIATAGLAGGLLAVLIVIALQASGLLPGPGGAAIDQAKELGDQVMAIDRRVAALESMNETMPGAARFDELAGRVGALEAARARTGSEVEVMQSALAGLSDRVGSNDPAAARRAVDALAERVARLETGGAASEGRPEPTAVGPVPEQVKQLTERVDALERRMTALAAAPETQSERAALAIAIGSLRRAAVESAPFAPDLAMISALGVEPDAIAELQPLAAEGIPSRGELADEFPSVGDAILAATDTIDPNASFFSRIGSNLRGLVSVRPVGPIEGATPVAIVSRMQAAVDRGDLAAALSERASLPEAGKAASVAWAAAAESRVKVDGLVEKIAAAVAMPTTE